MLYALHRRAQAWVGNLRMKLRRTVLGEVRPRMRLDNGHPEAEGQSPTRRTAGSPAS